MKLSRSRDCKAFYGSHLFRNLTNGTRPVRTNLEDVDITCMGLGRAPSTTRRSASRQHIVGNESFDNVFGRQSLPLIEVDVVVLLLVRHDPLEQSVVVNQGISFPRFYSGHIVLLSS